MADKKLNKQSKFANLDQWEEHLKQTLSDGDIVEANLPEEKLLEDCHFREIKDGKFYVQAEWDDWYPVSAKDIISYDLA